jgi:hypothetical protein
MSIEIRSLANKMNELDLSLENLKESDPLYKKGFIEYQNIKLKIKFILPQGLRQIEQFLNENGKKVYEKFYKKLIEQEIKIQGRRK